MLVRAVSLLFIAALTPFSWAQRPLFAPPKAKVVATPTPAPAVTPKPAPRRRAPAKVDLLADYVRTVKAAFTVRWADELTPLMKDFNPGAVSVAFKLDAEGKVIDFSVAQNSSNEAFAKFCEQFVRATEFEKPPEKALIDGHVEIPFTFSIY